MLIDGEVTDRLDVLVDRMMEAVVHRTNIYISNLNVFLPIPLREQVRPVMLVIKEEVQKDVA